MASENCKPGRVVLAYSGGLDTSCILVWLRDQGYEVIAFLANVGQECDFDKAREKALALGAKKMHIVDCRRELVTEHIWPWVQSGARYENRYMLGTPLARPCIARNLLEIVKMEKADFFSHGATGKGNDGIRFELACYALLPGVKVIAPWRLPQFYTRFKGRTDLVKFAEERGISIGIAKHKVWSMDENLIHTSYESGSLDDPDVEAEECMWQLTTDPCKAPDIPAKISITFERGIPIKVANVAENVEKTDPLKIYEYLNEIGGKHGIGRIDIIESTSVGMKLRSCYETRAGTILLAAHEDLEAMTMDQELLKIKHGLSTQFSHQVYNGMWFAPESEFTRFCIDKSQENVRGTVHMKLFKGSVFVVARESTISLYNRELASLDILGDYEPADSDGFTKINALRLMEHSRIKREMQLD